MKEAKSRRTGTHRYCHKLYHYIWFSDGRVEVHRHTETIVKFRCENKEELPALISEELKLLELQKQRDVYHEPETDFNQDTGLF